MKSVTVRRPTRALSIVPFFRWYDLWIGAYWDRTNYVLFLCVFPMFGLKIEMPRWVEWAPCWCPFMNDDHTCNFHGRGPVEPSSEEKTK